MTRSDEFVLMDDVQYTRRDWRNRNKVRVKEGWVWLTVPVQQKSRFSQSLLETRIDNAGNIIGRIAGVDENLPVIALGSHTDTVPKGGKYDGALGVMAAIEVIRTLKDQGHTTKHSLEVINFTNEEGTRFHRWLVGSRSMCGLLEQDDLDAVDDDGFGLGPCLADIGGDI